VITPKLTAWEHASRWIIEAEGGEVNDPSDSGGHTKFGISKRSYPHVDIASLTRDRALDIYRTDYWSRAGCHDLPAALALVVFDHAVLSGPRTAVAALQRAVLVTADGIVGPATIAAAKAAM
jgi:lysozyme family protein